MSEELVRVYGDGENRDEGGTYHRARHEVPDWVKLACRRCCVGCHDDFYNFRLNCNGNSWCWSLKPQYAKRKTRPPCYH